jgi:cytidylate kinase
MAIITISRGTFSGGKDLAECIAGKLDYKCLSREVLVEAASNYGTSLERLVKAINQKPGIQERMTLDRVYFLAYIQAALAKAASDERLVYHGHAGQLLLKDIPHVIRVRVIADNETRIRAAMTREKLTRQQAFDTIKKVDKERIKWTKFLFHVNLLDPSLYDIIVNLEVISVSQACKMLTALAESEEFQPTAQSQKALADLVLATDVRARLCMEEKVRVDEIEIDADDGVITILGSVHSLKEAEAAVEIARHSPGVKDVISRIKPTYHSLIRY